MVLGLKTAGSAVSAVLDSPRKLVQAVKRKKAENEDVGSDAGSAQSTPMSTPRESFTPRGVQGSPNLNSDLKPEPEQVWNAVKAAEDLKSSDATCRKQAAQALLQYHTTNGCKSLNLFCKGIDDRGVAALAEALTGNDLLEELGLDGNEIGDAGAKALAKTLMGNTKLQRLFLTNNQIGSHGACDLAYSLKDNKSLKELYLKGNNIGDKGAAALGEMLAHNTVLTDVRLSRNKVGLGGAKGIAKGLKANSHLAELDLEDNQLNDAAAQELGAALKKNSFLKELILRKNCIGDAGAKALAEGLHHNSSLRGMNLFGNVIGDKGGQALAEIFMLGNTGNGVSKSNMTLRELNIRGNKITDEEGVRKMFPERTSTGVPFMVLVDTVPSSSPLSPHSAKDEVPALPPSTPPAGQPTSGKTRNPSFDVYLLEEQASRTVQGASAAEDPLVEPEVTVAEYRVQPQASKGDNLCQMVDNSFTGICSLFGWGRSSSDPKKSHLNHPMEHPGGMNEEIAG